jgi:hypothetical protein
MEVHTLEIDSSERDYSKYPDPHDYVIDLKNEIYDIQKITLLSARIPNSQTLIHGHNNTFSVNTFQGSAEDVQIAQGSTITDVNTDFTTNDLQGQFNGQSFVITNTSSSVTKYLDFTGTESPQIGIPTQSIEIIPGGTYTAESVILGTISSVNFDLEYVDITRQVTTQATNSTNRSQFADMLSYRLGGDLDVEYIDDTLQITNTSVYTYAITFTTNSIGLPTGPTTIAPGGTLTGQQFTNTIPEVPSLSFNGGYYSSGTTLASDLNIAFGGSLQVTFTNGRLFFKNTSGSNYQITLLSDAFGVSGTPLVLPGETYEGEILNLNPVPSMTISYTISNDTKSVSFPGGVFKMGESLASSFSSSSGLRTTYVDDKLRVFNDSIFDITLRLSGTTVGEIGLSDSDILISPSSYHDGTTDVIGIIPAITFTIQNIETAAISLPNRSFANGDDLASNITDHVSGFIVTYDSNTNALSWLNDGNYPAVLKFGDGVNARYGLGTLDDVSNLITSNFTTPHQVFGLPPQNITIAQNESFTGGSINLEGPNAMMLRLGTGSETFNKDVYIREPFFTGQLLLDGPFIKHSIDDPIEHTFFSGPQKNLKQLHITFFTMSQGRLIPYDFRNQEHVLKFKIECSTGKFKAISKHTASDVGVLPPPISIPELEDPYRWNQQYILIIVIAFLGIFTLFITRKRT